MAVDGEFEERTVGDKSVAGAHGCVPGIDISWMVDLNEVAGDAGQISVGKVRARGGRQLIAHVEKAVPHIGGNHPGFADLDKIHLSEWDIHGEPPLRVKPIAEMGKAETPPRRCDSSKTVW